MDTDDKMMSAQEARDLMNSWGDNRIARLIGETDDETVLEIRGESGKWHLTDSIEDRYASLLAAAPRAIHTVIARTEELDRLRRVLAVERGDEAQAPDGWKVGPAGWCVYGPDGQAAREVERAETDGPWEWFVFESGGDGQVFTSGKAWSALEAMEAADAAMEASREH